MVFLNRALIIMENEGPKEALGELQSKDLGKDLGKYPLYHTILGDLYQKTGQIQQARACFELALNHSQSESEKLFIQKKSANL
jgi:RNA polymerase sigma-70 factor (ECF subfamily)